MQKIKRAKSILLVCGLILPGIMCCLTKTEIRCIKNYIRYDNHAALITFLAKKYEHNEIQKSSLMHFMHRLVNAHLFTIAAKIARHFELSPFDYICNKDTKYYECAFNIADRQHTVIELCCALADEIKEDKVN